MADNETVDYPALPVAKIADGLPFIVARSGCFVWVRPPFVKGVPNKENRRILCHVASAVLHGRHAGLEAVRVGGAKRREKLSGSLGIVITDPASLGMPKEVVRYRDQYNGTLGLLYDLKKVDDHEW